MRQQDKEDVRGIADYLGLDPATGKPVKDKKTEVER
jgi:hypothetical protein